MRSILSNHPPAAERRQHIVGAVEIRHFDVGRPDTLGIVRIRAHSWGNVELCCEVGRGDIMRRVRDLGVEHLDDVQLTRRDQPLQHRSSQSGTFRVKRVRRVHKATLCFDAVDHFRNRQYVWNALGQEQADNFSSRSADLFADDNPNVEIATQRLCRLDRVVVSDTHHVEVDRFDALGNFFQRRARIARGGGVQMAIEAYPTRLRRWRRPNGTKQQNGD